MVGDFVNTGGLLNVVEGISNSFSESGRSMVGGGVAGISVGNGGDVGHVVASRFKTTGIVGGGLVRGGVMGIRVPASMGVGRGGNINDMSGSLDLFTLVVVGGDGSVVSGGVGRGNVGRKERFTEEIRVSKVALTSGGNNGSNGFNVMVMAGRFNLVGSGGGGWGVEVTRGHGGSEGSFDNILVVTFSNDGSFVVVLGGADGFVMVGSGSNGFVMMMISGD